MKKSLLFFFLVFTFLSCSKKAESHDADIGRQEDQLVVQEEDKATQVESTIIDDTALYETETQFTVQENEEDLDDGKDYTKEYFKDYFDDSITNYEFYIRNPLFVSNEDWDANAQLFFEKPEMLAGKILKITKESYRIASDGNKYWGDSDIKDYSCDYYFFDSDFRITDNYFFNKTDSGHYFHRWHIQYKCNKNSYQRKNKKEYRGKIQNIIDDYQINKKKDGLELKKQDNKDFLLFSKNGVTEQKGNSAIIYELSSNKWEKSETMKTIDKLYQNFYICENGAEIDRNFNHPEGIYEYIYEAEDSGKYIEYYIENENVETKVPKRIVTRRFNPIGFMEYEFTQPYESVEGNYSIMTAEILDEPDEIFKESFDESWYTN